ncbi:hypothetical protein B296_00022995 [Ensete ventricosum]|uniref:Uncharacterized protein n=1 Tax=Ensete ventricosum TaxID=4639 RepID=A0A426XI22_ENSVE|nr:hypothetical protein B296_00022995 [Ensete ventricosum]
MHHDLPLRHCGSRCHLHAPRSPCLRTIAPMVSAATLGRHLAGERAPCQQVAMPLYGLAVGSIAPCGLAIGGHCPYGLAMASRPCRGLGRGR